jgi:tRNA A37 threonylcarbamoyladenosine dehydratase
MRRELRKRNILKQKVVFSSEATYKHFNDTDKVLGSISFVPSAEGLVMAAEIIKDLIILP